MQCVEYLKQMIPFSSVSTESNVDVSRRVEEYLQRLGFETEWLEYTDENGVTKICVSGRKGPDGGRGLAYFCHTDVVPVDTWSFSLSGPWEPLETDDRIYGRGSCDMRGSLACMLKAAEDLQDETLAAPLFIVCTADEEIGLKGAEHLVEHSAFYREIVERQCRGIVGEPTSLEVVHGHKGGRALEITSNGVAAHSSTDKGINANFAMIPFLVGIRQLCEDVEGQAEWEDDRYSPPGITLNLGINDYNYALNITPARSICTVNFRTAPAIDADRLVSRIRQLADDCRLDFKVLFSTEPLFSNPDSEFVSDMLAISGHEKSKTVSYGTDGSCFSEINDIVVFGPGDIRQAHTDDEWISLEQLERGTELFGELVRKWCVDG